MQVASVSATKAVLTSAVALPIHAPFSKHSLRVLVLLLLKDYPGSRLCGHRDLSPDLNHNGEIEPEEWVKQCPCFDAATILTEPPPPNPACL